MTYKAWTLVTQEEGNGIAVDYVDPQGNEYNEPLCFPTLDEAIRYGQICIDRLIQSQSKCLAQAYA
jgi:hypothetical protein